MDGVKHPNPSDPDESGNCKQGEVKKDGKCYPDKPKPPDGNGKCPDGYVKVDVQCIPLVPSGGGGGNGNGGGSFGGSCMAGFACDGDAIQCSIAREQYKRNCALFDDKSPESDLYNKEKGKDGSQTGNLPGNDTVNLTANIDTSNALGGGACVSDLEINVMGQSINIPVSSLCPYLEMLGNILVTVSLLLAIRIVFRG